MLSCECPVLRVLVADDHELTRLGLQLLLKKQDGIELVGLAENGLQAVELVRQHRPDVVVMDLQMPVMDGLSASKQIKTILPDVRILAYSSLDDPQTEVMLQMAQVDAFCKKDVEGPELLQMINRLGQSISDSEQDGSQAN